MRKSWWELDNQVKICSKSISFPLKTWPKFVLATLFPLCNFQAMGKQIVTSNLPCALLTATQSHGPALICRTAIFNLRTEKLTLCDLVSFGSGKGDVLQTTKISYHSPLCQRDSCDKRLNRLVCFDRHGEVALLDPNKYKAGMKKKIVGLKGQTLLPLLVLSQFIWYFCRLNRSNLPKLQPKSPVIIFKDLAKNKALHEPHDVTTWHNIWLILIPVAALWWKVVKDHDSDENKS